MSTNKTTQASETPVQDPEVTAKIVHNSSAGGQTAVGNERARLQAIADGTEFTGAGGSEIPIVGGDPKPDHASYTAPEPVGAQALPSLFTTNGSLPVNQVGSPTGLVPVSAVTADPAVGAQLVQANLDAHKKVILKSGSVKLSRAQIESMSAGDLRAVASDRSYDIGEQGGTRTTRRKFLNAQQLDDDLAEDTLAPDTAASTEA